MLNKKIMFLHSYTMHVAGGVERLISLYANYFATLDNKIEILHFGNKNQCFYWLNRNVKCISIKSRYQFFLIKFILRLFKFKPNVIIAFDPLANRLAAIVKFIIKDIVVVGTEHVYAKEISKTRYGYKLKSIKKCLYHKLDALTVSVEDSKKWLKENTTLTNVIVMPNPIIYPLIVTQPTINTNKFIKPNIKTILTIGRLTHQKGFDLLITSFSDVVKKHSSWQLVIIGCGNERDNLEKQIQDFGLQQKIFMPGIAGNLHQWYQSVDLFVLPSRWEGLNYVLLEAMAYGLPVISSACKGGPAYLVEHEKNGLLVEPKNIKDMTQAIIRLIEDKALRKKLAENAIYVKDKYNMEKVANQLSHLIDSLSS